MDKKAAGGGIALMLMGVAIPAVFQLTWEWGAAVLLIGAVLLSLSCGDWLHGSIPMGLSIGTASATTDSVHESTSADQLMFGAVQQILSSNDIFKLRNQQFFSTFNWDLDAQLTRYKEWADNPNNRFLDPSLEAIHKELRLAVSLLLTKVHYYSEQIPNGSMRGFSPLGTIDNMDEFEDHRNDAYGAAKAVCDLYEDLMLVLRRSRASGANSAG